MIRTTTDRRGPVFGVAEKSFARADYLSAGPYARVTDETSHQRYDYRAPAFEFACRLVYDESGLAIDYPGIAVRVG